MIESSTSEPQLCRVSVIGGNTQVDMVLPTTVPIAHFIPDVVTLVDSRNPNLNEHDEGVLTAQRWTLSRLGHGAIDPLRTLTEAEVYDGELLVLRTDDAIDAPALFDDVIDAVARLTESSFRGWTSASAARAGMTGALLAGLGACLLLLISKAHGQGLAAGGAGLGAGLLALVVATLSARMYAAEQPATALSLTGLLLMGSGAAALVPGALGAPHLLLGGAVVLLLAVLALRVVCTGPAMFSAVVTAATFTTGAAAAMTLWGAAPAKAAVSATALALLGITSAPRIAVWAARLPVPPVPTAGGAIDPRDHEPRPTVEGIGAIGATSIPSAAGLGRRANLANAYQTGIVLGIVLVAVAGTIVTVAEAAEHRWQAVALAFAVGIVLARRGRGFADLTQATALVLGGCTTLAAPAVLLGVGLHGAALPGAAALLVLVALTLLIGVAGPHLEISPLMQRAGEWFEYLLICAIGPLTFWILDIYALARNG
ncbi:type VII secretion integral membrane protein EccD [Nocardia sp. GAS34]|uniref:type VII secretion integral membrane protein EccD n=1 Tax=unclassified Nocardia TaxID=2637762 RepID=UPI003D19541C